MTNPLLGHINQPNQCVLVMWETQYRCEKQGASTGKILYTEHFNDNTKKCEKCEWLITSVKAHRHIQNNMQTPKGLEIELLTFLQ